MSSGTKPLSEPKFTQSVSSYGVTRPQWVKNHIRKSQITTNWHEFGHGFQWRIQASNISWLWIPYSLQMIITVEYMYLCYPGAYIAKHSDFIDNVTWWHSLHVLWPQLWWLYSRCQAGWYASHGVPGQPLCLCMPLNIRLRSSNDILSIL